MNISIAIVDVNQDYIKRLSEVLQQYEELIIHIYTNKQKFEIAMNTIYFDVVLFNPDISEENLIFSNVKLPICLYSDESRNIGRYADYLKIEKYQRISNIYKGMIRAYAEKAGYSADFDRSQNTEIIAVYSPAGGSGKTTVALAIASQLSSLGKTALYVNIEQLNSSLCVNQKKEDGIVALVEAVLDKRVNFELKVKGILKQGINGMLYIEGFERLVDYEAVSDQEVEDVLNKIRRCGICDTLIVDMESSLNPTGQRIIKLSDRVVIVENNGDLPLTKINLFAKQAFVNEYKHKLVRICNFADNTSTDRSELDIPIVGTIHNYGNLQLKSMIHSINANHEILLDRIIRK